MVKVGKQDSFPTSGRIDGKIGFRFVLENTEDEVGILFGVLVPSGDDEWRVAGLEDD